MIKPLPPTVSDYNPHHAHKIKKTSAVPEGGTELGVTEFVRIAWIIVPTANDLGDPGSPDRVW